MLKIGLFISGKLGFSSLLSILKRQDVNLQFVFTDRKSGEIISFCKQNNIDLHTGNPRNSNKAIDFLSNYKSIDVFLSINYLFIIQEEIINMPILGALNIHGSLLPKYRGRTPHIWAIINGEKKTGITVHKIEKEVDTGSMLIQKSIKIDIEDTGAKILEKFNDLYPKIIHETIELLSKGNIKYIEQDDTKATYFGKRTPEDGRINWDWSKERIHNWIRAQAFPYPGAFTYYRGNKLIINKISFSDRGFDYMMPNGLIISTSPFIVKTTNGAVQLIDYKFHNNINIQFEMNTLLR